MNRELQKCQYGKRKTDVFISQIQKMKADSMKLKVNIFKTLKQRGGIAVLKVLHKTHYPSLLFTYIIFSKININITVSN